MEASQFGNWVEVVFDCIPLRSVAPVTVPDDASPKLAEKLQRMSNAINTHGTLNSYFLHNATCTYHFTNDPQNGMCQFSFEGVVLTDANDMQARTCDLQCKLNRDTCSWINQSIVEWLGESVHRAVLVEFDRFIKAGDLTKTIQRMEALQQATDDSGGYVGMYL